MSPAPLRTRTPLRLGTLLLLGASLLADPAAAQPKPGAKPAAATPAPTETRLKPGTFPAPGSGTYLSGELVLVDPINRRGGLRIDGNAGGRYDGGALHYFALLPYAIVRLHGAPAELRDIPLGTHLHGRFHLPPDGDESTVPPLPEELRRHQIPQTFASHLADDFSHYADRGQSWKVAKVDAVKGKLDVVPGGTLAKEGIAEPYTFDIDSVARVWKDRRLVDLAEIAAGQEVRFDLAWAQGSRDKEFSVADLWLDETSRAFATELQRRRHVRFQQQRWLPGWIDRVELFDAGGAEITITLFGGMDPSLYADLKETQSTGCWVATAENTLRTWFHRGDRKVGKVLEWTEEPDPPPGSSGIRLRMRFAEVLEGYRPGRCVRVKCERWAFVTMPPEERVKSLEEQKRSAVLVLP